VVLDDDDDDDCLLMMPRSEHTVLKRENAFYLYVMMTVYCSFNDAA